jgi:phosphate/sulfate permease
MNDKTGSHRGARRAGALAVVAAIAALTTACDVVHVHVGSSAPPSTSTGSSTYQQHLAYAHCMQSHGMPGFPDPVPSTSFSGQVSASPGTVAARANDACKYLLSASAAAPTTTSLGAPSTTPSSAAGALARPLGQLVKCWPCG